MSLMRARARLPTHCHSPEWQASTRGAPTPLWMLSATASDFAAGYRGEIQEDLNEAATLTLNANFEIFSEAKIPENTNLLHPN